VFETARSLAFSGILALGSHTVTGMLASAGRQFEDWSKAYRIFEHERMDRAALFAPAQRAVLNQVPEADYLTVMMDDTLIRKRGRKVSGTAWKRDPLGPAWHMNFVWGQRFLQLSAALPEQDGNGRAVGIPLDFIHAPSAVKPKKNAPPDAWGQYATQKEECKVSAVASRRLEELVEQTPGRKIVCAVDGGYTNKTVFRDKEGVSLIGRIRKDACLYECPQQDSVTKGRKKYYGNRLPTPEEIRQSDDYPWQQVEAYTAGKRHCFDIKTLSGIRWKGTGEQDVRLVIVRPLAYRPRQGARLLYRDPAYLLCTDPDLPLETLLQSYLWRWEIEVNFRDEKHVLGVGQAQVRTQAAAKNVPAFVCAAYAYLLLAGMKASCNRMDLPHPKWNPARPGARCSTQQLISLFRTQLWGLSIGNKKTGFVRNPPATTKPLFLCDSLSSAVFHARK
jgi:hypothetical protein